MRPAHSIGRVTQPDREHTDAQPVRVSDSAVVRRAPRYRAFVLVGALAGVIVGVVLGLALRGGPNSPWSGPVALFLSLGLGVVGVLLGGLVAVLLDRPTRR